MAKHIDIEIDKLTNSIENSITGEVFATSVLPLVATHSREIKKKDWGFNWKKELKEKEKTVFKLVTVSNPNIVHGLISLEDKGSFILLHLIESARFNKGKEKIYLGVPGNLVAFACKRSFESGYEGFVNFVAKSKLIEHYKETLQAKVLYDNHMAIDTKGAAILVNKYFNIEDIW